MKENELRSKIAELLQNSTFDNGNIYRRLTISPIAALDIADTLIRHGLAIDMLELIDRKKVIYVPCKGYMRLYCDREIDDLKENAAAAEHRAKRAEIALKIAADLGELCAPVEDYIKQAEKILWKENNEKKEI